MRGNVLAYTRLSREQAANGYGLEAQRDAIEAWATRCRADHLEWVTDDGYTGAHTDRPGLQRALGLLARGEARTLVVAKLDRLSRSVRDLADVLAASHEQGWALVVLDPELDTTTATGRFTAHIMAAVAELERELISGRVRDGLAAARRRGVRLGRPSALPAATRGRVAALRAGGLTLRQVADRLTAEGVPTAAAGERWHVTQVRRVLRAHELETATVMAAALP